MIDDILFKLRWAHDGEWSARLTPEECKVLLAHLAELGAKNG